MLEWALLIAAAAVVGISKAGFGSGAGILAIPLMVAAIGADRMLGVLLPILILGDLFSVIHYLRRRCTRDLIFLLIGCIPGVVAGMLLLEGFRGLADGAKALGALVGVMCVAFVGAQAVILYRRWRSTLGAGNDGADDASAESGAASIERSQWGLPVGLLAGLSSTLAHAAGPIVAMFLIKRGHERRVFVGTTAWFFLGCNLMKLGPFVWRGLVTTQTIVYLFYLAPAVVVGTFVGAWLNKRVTATAFNVIVYVLVCVTGLKLVGEYVGVF
jgi:uncharacterized membrane protein YfcA